MIYLSTFEKELYLFTFLISFLGLIVKTNVYSPFIVSYSKNFSNNSLGVPSQEVSNILVISLIKYKVISDEKILLKSSRTEINLCGET